MPLIFTQPYITYGSYDANYASVALLMHMDGTDGSRVFVDEKNNPVSSQGNVMISTTYSKFGGASLACDGSGMLSVPHTPELNLGTMDFTVEFWFRPSTTNLSYQEMLVKGAGLQIYLQTNQLKLALSAGNNTSYFVTLWSQPGTIVAGNWYHVAVVKAGTTYQLFLNGTRVDVMSTPGTVFTGTDPVLIGAYTGAAYPFVGYIDEVRISNGVARYNSNFTVPSEPFGGAE